MRKTILSLLTVLAAGTGHAQSFGQAMADDFRSVDDFRISATCESVKSLLEKRNAPTLPGTRDMCGGQGYRTVRIYDLRDATRVVYLTPDNMVWKIGHHAHPTPNGGGRSAQSLRHLLEKYGRPVLEDGLSVDETVLNQWRPSTFDNLDFRLAWASSHLNPGLTENTVVELGCAALRQGRAECLSQQISSSNDNWHKHLSKLEGVIVVAKFHPTAHGMGSHSVESYLGNHLESARAASPAGTK